MNDIIVTCLLLSDRARMQDLARSFRENQVQADYHNLFISLGILTSIAASLWLLLRFADRYQRRWRPASHPYRLFITLCKAHQLKWSDRWLLWKLARSQRLRDPGRVFLEPERFDTTNLSSSLRQHSARIHLLRERLFNRTGTEEPLPATTSELTSAPQELVAIAVEPTHMSASSAQAPEEAIPPLAQLARENDALATAESLVTKPTAPVTEPAAPPSEQESVAESAARLTAPLNELAQSLAPDSLEQPWSVTTWLPNTEVITADTGTFPGL